MLALVEEELQVCGLQVSHKILGKSILMDASVGTGLEKWHLSFLESENVGLPFFQWMRGVGSRFNLL